MTLVHTAIHKRYFRNWCNRMPNWRGREGGRERGSKGEGGGRERGGGREGERGEGKEKEWEGERERGGGGKGGSGPTRPRDAFERLISRERVDRFTSGLLCSMSPFKKIAYLTDTDTRWCLVTARGTCRGEGVGDTPPSVTPRCLARLRSNLVCD